MAVIVTHSTVSTATDAGNGDVRKNAWNAPHVVTNAVETFAQSGTAVSVGAVTTEATLATISFTGGELGANGWIQVNTLWTTNNNANAKNLRIRVGGVAGTAMMDVNNTTAVFLFRPLVIANSNSASSQKAQAPATNGSGIGSGTAAPPTATVNTAAAWDLVITGQKANSADTITLEGYQVLVFYRA